MTVIVPTPSTKRLLETATATYQEQGREDDQLLKYLVEERGFSTEVLDYFRLGVVRSPIDGHDTWRGRISIPYLTSTGPVSIRFKYLGTNPGSLAKMLPMPGDIARPYNARAVVGQGRVAICEGEPDVWACWMAGIPAIGIPGANAWNPTFARIFRNREVVVLADNDDKRPDPVPEKWVPPGQRFADMIYKTLGGCEIKMMPLGYDVSSYLLAEGPEALRVKAGWHGEGEGPDEGSG